MKKTSKLAKLDKLDMFLIHELLHGAYLVSELFQLLGPDEEGCLYNPIFKRHPRLKKAYTKALYAILDFYQECGGIGL